MTFKGHSSSAEAEAGAERAYITLDGQITQIHGPKGSLLEKDTKTVVVIIIGANVVRAHTRFPCEGRRSGH